MATAKKETKAKAPRTTKAAASNGPVVSHFFEIDGDQVKTADIIDKVYAAYKADGHQIGRIKNVDVYYNFGERKAYYVVNGKAEDKFVEF